MFRPCLARRAEYGVDVAAGNGAVVDRVRLVEHGVQLHLQERHRAQDDAESGLVRYLGRGFENESTVERISGAGHVVIGRLRGRFRTAGGVAKAAAKSGMGRWMGGNR